jgi:NAD(P)-dependent dehydrogenase (short-subunit alcohol dehydrogenase family)
MTLNGKVALVTGGTRGIGAAIARRLAREGADVAVTYVTPGQKVNALVTEVEGHGRRALAIEADSADAEAIRAAVDRTVRELGRLDILVNNAAEQHETDQAEEIDLDQVERTFRTNVVSFFSLTKFALKHMKQGSSIINTTSVVAYKGHKTLLDYAATKGAIVAFTRALAEALVDKEIRVNAVAPGPIWTPLIPASFDADHVAKHGAAAPMERAGQPNEVAPCYVFLASEEASYMTGQVLHPNGGSPVDS